MTVKNTKRIKKPEKSEFTDIPKNKTQQKMPQKSKLTESPKNKAQHKCMVNLTSLNIQKTRHSRNVTEDTVTLHFQWLLVTLLISTLISNISFLTVFIAFGANSFSLVADHLSEP